MRRARLKCVRAAKTSDTRLLSASAETLLFFGDDYNERSRAHAQITAILPADRPTFLEADHLRGDCCGFRHRARRPDGHPPGTASALWASSTARFSRWLPHSLRRTVPERNDDGPQLWIEDTRGHQQKMLLSIGGTLSAVWSLGHSAFPYRIISPATPRGHISTMPMRSGAWIRPA